MRFGVLGPLLVQTDEGAVVRIPGSRTRVLLASLLADRDRVVSVDRLIEDLWRGDPPADPAAALQVRVSQLRRAFEEAEHGARALVESHPRGYRLRATAVDSDRFATLTASDTIVDLTAALALWRGDAYADVATAVETTRAEAARLQEQRLLAHERLATLQLEAGMADRVVADLAGLAAQHPLREGLRLLQMRALAASGRRADALAVFAQVRAGLAERLGVEPRGDLQALHRGLLVEDAAPRLPARVDRLIGREETLRELRTALDADRLVTLVGPGGVGKTRLALELARERDGAWFVELAAVSRGAESLAATVSDALGIRDPAGGEADPDERILAVLQARGGLVVLDNVEHVVERVAGFVARLLREASEVRVLATGREPLGLSGERVWEVAPLALPPTATDDPDAIRRSPAVELFTARAGAHQRTFALDGATAPVVAEICTRLDGLPLALELAAARIRTLGAGAVLERLADRFALLGGGARDAPERHRTLAAVIGWSWELLDPGDRECLAQLSVFRGGFTLAAADVVAGADADTVERLVRRSLVVADTAPDGVRHRLLESIAAFAAERLEAEGGTAAARERHAAYFSDLAASADPALRGPHQRRWLGCLDAETDNLRVVLAGGAGAPVAPALCWYWFLRGRIGEARRRLAVVGDRAPGWRAGFALLQGEDAQVPTGLRGREAWFVAHALLARSDVAAAGRLLDAAADGADAWTQAAVLSSRALLAHASGDLDALETAARRSADAFAALGDDWGVLKATGWLGGLAELRGEYERAAALQAEVLRRAEAIGLWPEVADALSWLAWIAIESGEPSRARPLAERAHRLAREHGETAALAFAELGLGFAARREGRLDDATAQFERLLERAGDHQRPALYLPMVLVELGHVAADRGDARTALARHLEAFAIAERERWPRDAVGALEAVASAQPDPRAAARLLGAAASSRDAAGLAPGASERDGVRATTARLLAALGDAGFRAAYDAGRALSPGEAIAAAVI